MLIMEATSDTLLASAARNGDRAAYGELFTRYQSRIYNYAYGIAGNRDDAADIAQEAFARVFEALPRVTGELNFSAYVYRTAHNVAIDTVKGRSRFEDPEVLDIQMEPSLRADPERVALVQEQQRQAWQAAFRLSDDHRAILTLRELHGLSYQEIAEIMDMPRNTVGVLLSRARLRFKEAFRMSSVDIDKLTAECQDMLPLLSAYIDDELDEQKRARVESHLEQCAFCRLALEEMTESSRSYRALLPLLPPAGLGEGLWLRLGDNTAPTQTASSAQTALSAQTATPFQTVPSGQPAPPYSAGGGFPTFLNTTGSGIPAPKSGRRDPLPRLLAIVGGIALVLVLGGALLASWVLDGRDGSGDDGAVTTGTTGSSLYSVDSFADVTTVPTTSTVTVPTTIVPSTAPASEEVDPDPTTSSVTEARDVEAPPTPGIIYPATGTVVTGSTVTLRWKPVKDPSGVTYRVEVQSFDDKAGEYVTSQLVDGIKGAELMHVIASTRERWRVTAIDGAGNMSGSSAWAKFAHSTADLPLVMPTFVIPAVPLTTTTTVGLY
jgi:RNA polymerase sigma-70 factor (ECF subfamily)